MSLLLLKSKLLPVICFFKLILYSPICKEERKKGKKKNAAKQSPTTDRPVIDDSNIGETFNAKSSVPPPQNKDIHLVQDGTDAAHCLVLIWTMV